jgi:hypothetical protein
MVDPDSRETSSQLESWLRSQLAETESRPDSAEIGTWSERARLGARSILAQRARRVYRRRVAAALAAACVPLPFVVVYARALLGWLHDGLALILPAPLPDVAVASYAATTALLVAVTFAAIPVLVELAMRGPRAAHGE